MIPAPLQDPVRIGMIWAQAADRVIGAGGTMPWHVPEDLARFQSITRGHPVIMGRKTWESLPPGRRPLAERTNIVISGNRTGELEGALSASSLQEALQAAASAPGSENVWFIGGASLYSAGLDFAHVIHMTEIDSTVPGDTFAPEPTGFTPDEPGPWLSSTAGLRFRFRTWTRTPGPVS